MSLQRKSLFILTFIVINVCITNLSKAQVVYSTKYASDANVKVYVSKYKSDADLVVYKTQYKSDADGNNGIWFFTEYASDAKRKYISPNIKATPISLFTFLITKAMQAG